MARARRGDPVDGVLLLDKPSGSTSNFVLQKARRLLGAAKAGHTGTLDPLASGLLPLTFGEATKFSADLLDAAKTYEAQITLGVTTTTADAEGEVTRTRPVAVTHAQVESVLSQFLGSITQVPPMYSALKRDGKPLYAYAREGIDIEREAREVTIFYLDLLAFDGATLRVSVDCSKGTYVRVLAQDIGERLGCGAHLSALRRTRVADLSVDHAVTLAALEQDEPSVRRARLLPPDALIARLPCIDLDDVLADRFVQGQRLPLGPGRPTGRVRVVGPHARLLGTAQLDEHGLLAPQRLVHQITHRNESPS